MKKFFLLSLILCALLCGCGYQKTNIISYDDEDTKGFSSAFDDLMSESPDYDSESESYDYDSAYDSSSASTDATSIYVSIVGEVKNPGVYILPKGSRMYELINEAGGTTDDADTTAINLVEILEDGTQTLIPKMSNEDNPLGNKDGLNTTSGINSNGQVNINKATVTELETLTGIGQARARAIIEYRDKNGPFSKPEDIMNVAGIKEATYNTLKDEICVK